MHSELTTFVGRARLLANLKRHLGGSRLVTVTGIGGVGKSRTVLHLAHQVRPHYPDGVWFADLASLQDAGMVKHTIAYALGIADQSSRAESESLSEWVGRRNMLLIIDSCEHLIHSCAELVHELLEAAPHLKVLATSRQSLHLPYEHVVPVPPLQVPGDDPGESLFANESVRLFAARAVAGVPDFALDGDNIAPVAELCRRLDGIPLAIELAAVRLRALSVEQILGLLADRFSLLAGASRTALPRHQTLRATINWSHELCEPPERLLWARLSVFAGDFQLDAARFVCSDERLPPEHVPALLGELVEKSILLFKNDRDGGRYRLIDTLAEYGAESLAQLGQSEQLRRRHLEYYLSLAQRSEDAWSGARQIYWFVRMRQERENVRVALDHALKSAGRQVLALRLLSSLWFMWVCCGFAREGRLYLERALEANPAVSRERCKALWVLSYVKSAQGDSAGALAAAERCNAEAVEIGDWRAVILASKMQGTAALLQGDLQKASALLGMAIKFNGETRELNPGLLPAIVEQSIVLTAQGELSEAESLLQDCLQLCEECGELWVSSHAHWVLADNRLATERLDEALFSVRQSLRIKRDFHDTLGTLLALETAARIFVALRHLPVAARLLGALQDNWRTVGSPQMGAGWMAGQHDTCVQECRRQLGELAYKDAFEEGARLDLAEATALALGERDVLDSTALEIRVTDGDDDAFAKVEDAVVQVAGAFGFEVPTADRARDDRYVMRSRAGSTDRPVDERLEELFHALHDESPRGERAWSGVVRALVAALEEVNRAAVLVEQTLLVKVNGKRVIRRLSAAEQAYLDNHRVLLNDPAALLHELDQLEADGRPVPFRRAVHDDRELMLAHLGEPAARALAGLADRDFEVSVSTPLWVRSGHTESRLLALIVKPPPGSDERTSKVVAKTCPPGPPSREPAQHDRAWRESPVRFRKEHLVRLKQFSPPMEGGGHVLLMDVAGGGFATTCQLAELESAQEIADAFDAVAHGLVRDWNARRRPELCSDLDSGAYLRGELRGKFDERGRLRALAEANGLLHPDRHWIAFGDEQHPQVLPNPLAMAAGQVVAHYDVQHLRGLTHGDLHQGNILIPRTREGELLPQQYRLVDLTTFDRSAPLTRDRAMLLLSVVAGHPPQDAHAEEDLFGLIVLGKGRHDLFAALTRTARDPGAQLVADGFRDEWLTQLLLSLQAAALLHCSFGNLDERLRWWFFRLAARCGAEYLRSVNAWRPPARSVPLLALADVRGFLTPPAHP
uniref:Disease resistance domain-containing protein / Tetratricopeptide repeat-containing protein n=1 Tax=Nonomuraea gerenzanensis TaxID=93944 RepID=A0A1M4E5J0_9ACTN|nr:Disease resistance domain-containing protein / Tetratricopeptide repeat-containing protein [Nonomuraea gerenzanensis]